MPFFVDILRLRLLKRHLITCFLWITLKLHFATNYFLPGFWGMIVAFVVYIVVCSVTKPAERTAEIINSINDKKIPEG